MLGDNKITIKNSEKDVTKSITEHYQAGRIPTNRKDVNALRK
jgi:hypothetical protein